MGPVTQLLSDPNKWTKTTLAQTTYDHNVPPQHSTAAKWSVRGALMKHYQVDHVERLLLFMEVANKYYPIEDYEKLHQALTHEALMFILKETGL